MAKKILKELSLLPNLGLSTTGSTVGTMNTTGTTSSLNTPGSKAQNIAKLTAATTKQINDLVGKIAAAKAKAQQTGSSEQKALLQTVSVLQQQLQQLVSSEQEEARIPKKKFKRYINNHMDKKSSKVKEGVVSVLKKGAGAAGGGFLGKVAGTAVAGPLGGLAGSVIGAGLGAEAMDDDEENKKMKKKKKFKKKPVQEGIMPAIGGAASGAIKTAGNVAGMVPVVGAPVKAAADLASDVTKGVLGGGENEEGFEQLTPAQEEVVNALAKRKYWVNKVSYQFAEQEGGPTVYMMKKPNKYSTHYAEVSPDGMVNGEDLNAFLGGREENEEKILSKQQQRIARLAGDPNKIDAADFAKLKAMKESAQIPVFLSAILRKNYAQADKYLGSIINRKIKGLINTALDKNL